MNMHPAGLSDAVILEHGIGRAQTGTEQVIVRFETDHGTIMGFFALTDKAAEYTIEKLRNMGFQGDDLAGVNSDVLVGNRCVITVAHETYNGQTKARVKYVNPEGYQGAAVEKDAEAAANVKKFNVLLKKAARVGAPRRAATDDENDSRPPLDEDIPF